MSQYHEKQIAKTRTIIQRWHGKSATLRKLTESHPTLEILVFENGETMMTHNLLISCLDPFTICSPVNWENNAIEVVTSSMNGANIAVVDKTRQVEIHATSFEVRENVKL